MADRLAVWLYGTRVAAVEEARHRLRLEYTAEALQAFPGGTPLLSLMLPLTAGRFPNGITRAFLDGLLPEGDARRAIAEDFSLRADDTFGLIRAIGRDCAGALVIQPDDETAPPPATTLTAERLTESDLAGLVANLRSAPLGAGSRVRISLAGVQEKLLLTRLPDGAWGRPVDGTPSTHILKPQIPGYYRTVENEAFCMRLARYVGVDVAQVETLSVAGQPLLAVTRYDRKVDAAGTVERIHQEDLCQATGTAPLKKYQADGGPSLRRIAAILRANDPDSLQRLLRAVTVNVVVGNGDAHAKNFSLLHDLSGKLRLAPCYDILCTTCYGDDRLAMLIDNVQRTARVTLSRLVNEAAAWGLPRDVSESVIDGVLDAVPEAANRAALDTPGVVPEIQIDAVTRAEALRAS